MEQTILTKTQKTALAFVANEPALADFYLTGGTALAAYYLGHRHSDDLDFFTFTPPDARSLHAVANRIKEAVGARSTKFERLHDRYQFFFLIGKTELKVEFAHFPFPQLTKPKRVRGLRVDSLRDIAANKLMALIDRFDPKDFVDLYFLIKKEKLDAILKDTQKKFGVTIDPIFLGGELAKARRIEALPKMYKPLTTKTLKAFFATRAKALRQVIFD